MALLICPDCQKEISDQASHCVHCGCPLKAGQMESDPAKKLAETIKSKLWKMLGSALTFIVGVFLAVYFGLGWDIDTARTWLGLRAPSCSDADVKRTVLELVEAQLLDRVFSAEILSEMTFELKLVRTSSLDKDTGSYSCAANLSILNAEDFGLETPITYASQLGENRGEFVVSTSFERPLDIFSFSSEYQKQKADEAFSQELDALNNLLEAF